MALYHFHMAQVKRSAGQSAVASAAYRAGEKLYSDYYGESSDYSNMDEEMFSVVGKSSISVNKLYVALTRTKGDLYLIKQGDFKKVRERYLKE